MNEMIEDNNPNLANAVSPLGIVTSYGSDAIREAPLSFTSPNETDTDTQHHAINQMI
jgi:valyl-tRNA synthetase